MAFFDQPESRDELGLGTIRDSIADILFPGTSTIQTRLQYMLFVPWIFKGIENGATDGNADKLVSDARVLELHLTEALEAGGESTGIIGRVARAKLQRLPSSIYWVGLEQWGIRRFHGSIESYFRSIPGQRRSMSSRRKLDEFERVDRDVHNWHPGLPAPPRSFRNRRPFG